MNFTVHPSIDLIIIPQRDQRVPGKHLTPQEFAQAQNDWHHYTLAKYGQESWAVAVAHIIDGDLCVTSTVRIRRNA